MGYKKVGIIGVGNVGSTLAFSLALKELCNEILLKDIREDFTQAMALDISQSISEFDTKTKIKAVSKDEEFNNCDVVVITAGIARKPGMSRDDLLFTNAKIMQSIVQHVVEYNKDAILIIVSNPLDAMVYTALKMSGFPKNRVLGMAGVLDSSRMAHFIKEKIECEKIEAMVLGGHGDDMVPLIKETKIDGKALDEVLNENEIEEIINKTKNGGIEIVKLLKTGSAYYAPGYSTALMVEAILKDTKQIYPCAIALDGEYGYTDVVSGVPVVLGKDGAQEIVEIELSEKEKEMFSHSINSVKTLIDKLESHSLKS